MTLGERIKKAREGAGLRQRELAEQLQIALPTLNKYENGHRVPDASLVAKIAEITGCDPGWLLTGNGRVHRSKIECLHVGDPGSPYIVGETDPVMLELIEVLRDHPEVRKETLEILKAKLHLDGLLKKYLK